MRTSNHQRLETFIFVFRTVCLAILVEAAAISSFAQNHMKHANDSTPTIKAADIVREPPIFLNRLANALPHWCA